MTAATLRMAAADMAAALRQVRSGTGTPATRIWLALGTVYLVWGSTYLGIKYAIDTMPPLLMGSLRFLLFFFLDMAFLLLSSGHLYRDVFAVAIVPGILAVICFAVFTRDPRTYPPRRKVTWEPLPAAFWRLLVAVGVFGIADFAPTFMTLRAAEMIQVQAGEHAAVLSAIGFYIGMNAIGSVVSFPAGWLTDRLGKPPVLAAGYALFGAACLVGAFAHGTIGVIAFLLPAGAYGPLVKATEDSFVGSLVEDRLRGTAYGVKHAVKVMLETGNLSGKCADLNALYVAMARSVGLPARDVYGVRVAKSAFGYRSLGAGTENVTRAQHCRAQPRICRRIGPRGLLVRLLIHAGSMPLDIAANFGPCGSSPDLLRRRRRMHGTATCWPMAEGGSRSRSTCLL